MADRPEQFRMYDGHPLAQGLVFAGLGRHVGSSHYRDSSPYGNHGVLTNMDPVTDWVWVPELGRWAVDFDGVGDKVTCPAAGVPIGDTPFTLSSWCYLRVNGRFLGFGDGTWGTNLLFVNPKVYLQHRTSTGVERYANSVLNSWHHVAGTYDGTNYSVAIDGAGTGNTATYGASNLVDKEIRVGWGFSQGNVIIADTLLYDRALPPAEIQQLADPSNVMLSGLILPPRRRLFASAGGAPAVNAPTGHLYGPLVGSLGGPV